jgi:IS30 family transposase
MGTHYSHVTEADRISIQALVQAKLSGREIGRQLNLSHSSISRELSRGKSKPTVATSSYQAGVAHVRARAR